MRTLLLYYLAYACLVSVARSRSWICACWSHGRAPGSVPAGRVIARLDRCLLVAPWTCVIVSLVFLYPPPLRGEEGGVSSTTLSAAALCRSVNRSLLNRFTDHTVLPLLLNRGGGVSIDVVVIGG
jgi:hypothetical protein